MSGGLSSSRWRVIEPLLDAALDMSPERRRAYLDEACGGDVALREEVERMAAECATPDADLDSPAASRFARLLDDTTPPPLPPGLLVLRELGRGGMATVYLARDEKHDRDVAVKVLRPEVGMVLGTVRFLTEIRVTANLRHPHILPLFDSGEYEGRLYYVMQHAEGGSLRERLSREGPLPVEQARRIAVQVADALAEAHAHGVVHRDIKPENILLTRDGQHAYVADFGVALAISGNAQRVTRSGFVLGTRAYMSPEQTHGVADLDGRSDVYSLGCVVHEMLTGRLPDGTTSRETLADRADPATCDAVLRAVSHERDARFATAEEFARALERTGAATARVPSPARRTLLGASLAAAATLASVLGVREWRRGIVPADVDPDVIAVLPFEHDGGAGPTHAMLNGDNCARLLYDRLGRWQRLELSDEMRVADARRARGRGGLTLDDARALATRVGAGRFVWGSVTPRGDGSMRVAAALYDRRRARPIRYTVIVPASGDADEKLGELADSLVVSLAGMPSAVPASGGTRHFDALKQYADGYEALHAWDTPAAERHFRAAVSLDASFAEASLALAQTMSWSGRYAPAEWREPAARAVNDSTRLGARDRALAGALFALAEQQPQRACALYRELIARDPRDFAAHFGLGECLSRDRVVVRDASSSTGWRFRASVAEAVREYTTALQLVPSYFEAAQGGAFAALAERVLPTDEGYVQGGYAVARDTLRVAAFPELIGDSLVYRPMPFEVLFTRDAPPTQGAALARNRETLRVLTARWTAAFPRSAAAWQAYARALEAVGTLDASAPNAPSALRAASTARRLGRADATIDAKAAARAAATEARILLRLGRFAQARAVAESALADTVRVTEDAPRGAESLAALAAFTGRARLTARLLERAAVDSSGTVFWVSRGTGPLPPAPALRAAAVFAGHAALAAPGDSLRVAYESAARAIDRWVPMARRAGARSLLLARNGVLAQPTLGAAAVIGLTDVEGYEDRLRLWQEVARGDSATVRRRIREPRTSQLSSIVRAPDWLLQRAHLALAVRDTAVARAMLDELITSLPAQAPRVTEEVPAAAAVGRGLALRAAIAPPNETAAAAARALWESADPEVRAMIGRLPAGPR